ERPELFLFDLHHHLLAGETGEIVAASAGLCGLFFVISGAILWWRTRRTFEFRLIPRRLSRPAILRHHRDLGIVFAPLLALVMFTGTT
ncbi:PepSY-associated TM helix domain-containing protein, partial [Acinetobacter baumannii]